jgi:hypothetical protein
MFNIVKRRDFMLANDTSTLQEAKQLLLTNYGRDYIVKTELTPAHRKLRTPTVAAVLILIGELSLPWPRSPQQKIPAAIVATGRRHHWSPASARPHHRRLSSLLHRCRRGITEARSSSAGPNRAGWLDARFSSFVDAPTSRKCNDESATLWSTNPASWLGSPGCWVAYQSAHRNAL